jgi:hypothetical protein
VGYASIVACMISFGDIPSHPLPRGVQLDWEAILTLSPAEFIAAVRPMLQTRTPVSSFLPSCWLQQGEDRDEEEQEEQAAHCSVDRLVKTARDAIFLMNGMYDE